VVVVVEEEEAMPTDRNGDGRMGGSPIRFLLYSLRKCRLCAVEREMWDLGTGRAHGGEEERGGISLACGPRGAVFFFLFLRA